MSPLGGARACQLSGRGRLLRLFDCGVLRSSVPRDRGRLQGCPRTQAAASHLWEVPRVRGEDTLSATHPTRLETRTKESNMCASQWALRTPQAQ